MVKTLEGFINETDTETETELNSQTAALESSTFTVDNAPKNQSYISSTSDSGFGLIDGGKRFAGPTFWHMGEDGDNDNPKESPNLSCDGQIEGFKYDDSGERCIAEVEDFTSQKPILVNGGGECMSLHSRSHQIFTTGNTKLPLNICVHTVTKIRPDNRKMFEKWVFKVTGKGNDYTINSVHTRCEDLFPSVVEYMLKSRCPLPVPWITIMYATVYARCREDYRDKLMNSFSKLLDGKNEDKALRSQILYQNYSSFSDDALVGIKSQAIDKELSASITLFQNMKTLENHVVSEKSIESYINDITNDAKLLPQEEADMREYNEHLREQLTEMRLLILACLGYLEKLGMGQSLNYKDDGYSIVDILIDQAGKSTETLDGNDSETLDSTPFTQHNPGSGRNQNVGTIVGILSGIFQSVENGPFRDLRSINKVRNESMPSSQLFDALDTFYLTILANLGFIKNKSRFQPRETGTVEKEAGQRRVRALYSVINFVIGSYINGSNAAKNIKSLNASAPGERIAQVIYPRFTEFFLLMKKYEIDAIGIDGDSILTHLINGYGGLDKINGKDMAKNFTMVYGHNKVDRGDGVFYPLEHNRHRFYYYAYGLGHAESENSSDKIREALYQGSGKEYCLNYFKMDPRNFLTEFGKDLNENFEYYMTFLSTTAAHGHENDFFNLFEIIDHVNNTTTDLNQIDDDKNKKWAENYAKIPFEKLMYAAIIGNNKYIIYRLLYSYCRLKSDEVTKGVNSKLNWKNLYTYSLVVGTTRKYRKIREEDDITTIDVSDAKRLFEPGSIFHSGSVKLNYAPKNTNINGVENSVPRLLAYCHIIQKNMNNNKNKHAKAIQQQLNDEISPITLVTLCIFAMNFSVDNSSRMIAMFIKSKNVVLEIQGRSNKHGKNILAYCRSILLYRLAHESSYAFNNSDVYTGNTIKRNIVHLLKQLDPHTDNIVKEKPM